MYRAYPRKTSDPCYGVLSPWDLTCQEPVLVPEGYRVSEGASQEPVAVVPVKISGEPDGQIGMANEDEGIKTDNGILNIEGQETNETNYSLEHEDEQEKEQKREQGASAQGEPHSRVGGILECDPPSNRNSPSKQACNESAGRDDGDGAAAGDSGCGSGIDVGDGCAGASTTAIAPDDNDHGICRYIIGVTRTAIAFIEYCQIRLQYIFPYLVSPPRRYNVCEGTIEKTAECLANDVIRYLLKEDIYLISRDPISRSMRHSVYQMLNKHSILFASMVNRLNVVPDTAYESFMGVANELFLHGDVTWAKIVCLYAFTGRLALWARDCKMHGLKKKLPLYVSRFIGEKVAHFIKGYGGWEYLCIVYPVAEEISGAVWRSLLMTGATLGLVATLLTVTS